MTHHTRRRFLELAGVTGVAGLAGCSDTQKPGGDVSPDPDTTTLGERTESPTESGTNAKTPTRTKAPQSVETDWPQFQFDAHNSGHNLEGTGPKNKVAVKWRFKVGAPVRTVAVVKSDTVYLNADQLYALSADDGSTEWTFPLSGGGTTPAVADRTVYVSGPAGTVYAVNADDGSEKWRTSHGKKISPPTVQLPRVFVGSRAGIAAFDAATGDQLWLAKHQSDYILPVVESGTVYNLLYNNHVVALDVGDGSKQWKRFIGRTPKLPLTLIKNKIYNINRNKIKEIDSSGRVSNIIKIDNLPLSSPAADSNTLYLSTQNDLMQAIDMSGKQKWSFDTGADSESAPALVGGVLYFGSNDRNVYAVDATTGDKLWSFTTGRIVKSPPAVAKGTVYIGSDDGYLYALHEKE